MANINNTQNNKRSIDVLASLDAVFSSKKKAVVVSSKYTSHDAAQAVYMERQQIYNRSKCNMKKNEKPNFGIDPTRSNKQKINRPNTTGNILQVQVQEFL